MKIPLDFFENVVTIVTYHEPSQQPLSSLHSVKIENFVPLRFIGRNLAAKNIHLLGIVTITALDGGLSSLTKGVIFSTNAEND